MKFKLPGKRNKDKKAQQQDDEEDTNREEEVDNKNKGMDSLSERGGTSSNQSRMTSLSEGGGTSSKANLFSPTKTPKMKLGRFLSTLKKNTKPISLDMDFSEGVDFSEGDDVSETEAEAQPEKIIATNNNNDKKKSSTTNSFAGPSFLNDPKLLKSNLFVAKYAPAAKKIQSSYRGYKCRVDYEELKIKTKNDKCATKIQSLIRGHLQRLDHKIYVLESKNNDIEASIEQELFKIREEKQKQLLSIKSIEDDPSSTLEGGPIGENEVEDLKKEIEKYRTEIYELGKEMYTLTRDNKREMRQGSTDKSVLKLKEVEVLRVKKIHERYSKKEKEMKKEIKKTKKKIKNVEYNTKREIIEAKSLKKCIDKIADLVDESTDDEDLRVSVLSLCGWDRAQAAHKKPKPKDEENNDDNSSNSSSSNDSNAGNGDNDDVKE